MGDGDHTPVATGPKAASGWRELYLKENWWAVWLGLAIILAAWAFFVQGSSIKWLAVMPAKWSALPQLGAHLAAVGRQPFLAFTTEVGVNVVIGYVLSVFVFGAYWSGLGNRANYFGDNCDNALEAIRLTGALKEQRPCILKCG